MARKLTIEKVEKRLQSKRIQLLDEYVNVKKINEFRCLVCNHTWETSCRSILVNGSGCPKCNSSKLTNEIIDERICDRHIKRLGDYKNKRTNLLWECLVCGFNWEATPGNVVINSIKSGCPRCAGKIIDDYVVDERLQVDDREIKRIGTVKSVNEKIEWLCLSCDVRWFATPSNVLYYCSGCPACVNKGEKELHKLIIENVCFDELKTQHKMQLYGKTIVVDFLLKKNDRVVVIERNGEQHYQPVRFGGISQEAAESNFHKQQKRDRFLERWCDRKGWDLIIVPFSMSTEDIIDILKNI